MLRFFTPMEVVPRTTAQQKKFSIKTKTFYNTGNLKKSKATLQRALSGFQLIDTNDARKLHRRYANLEKKAVDEYKLSASRQMANNVFQELFIDTLGIPLLALRNRGYGKKRLEEVFNETMTIFKDYHEERFTFDDVSRIIKEETGIDFIQAKEDFIQWLRNKAKENEKFNEHLFVYTMDEVQDGRETM